MPCFFPILDDIRGTTRLCWSSGLQVVRWNRTGSEREKEAVTPGDYWEEIGDKEVVLPAVQEETDGTIWSAECGGSVEKRARGRMARWLWMLFPIILLMMVAGTVTSVACVGRMASLNKPTRPSFHTFKSQSGAYNGTSMAVVDPDNGVDTLWLFYQDYTGDIRRLVYSKGVWHRSQSLSLDWRTWPMALHWRPRRILY